MFYTLSHYYFGWVAERAKCRLGSRSPALYHYQHSFSSSTLFGIQSAAMNQKINP